MLQRTDEIAVRVGPYDLSEDCLPDKPSALIRVALADLERTLLSPAYRFDFGEWYEPQPDGTCTVCLGGGVLAQAVGAGPQTEETWARVSHITTRKLFALSDFALGKIGQGLREIKSLRPAAFLVDRDHDIGNLNVLKGQLDTLANDLESAGL